jgi:hypothetical protein
VYWRRDLYRAAAEVRRKAGQKVWREASLAVLEIKLMTGCYFVRRLKESSKIPDALWTGPIRCVQVLPREGARPHRFRPPIDFLDAIELFDFGGCTTATVSINLFVNQFIHSEVLIFLGPDDPSIEEGIAIVASDSGRRKRLLCFWLRDIADFFERVALTEPTEWQSVWDWKSESYLRSVDSGKLDDRLVEWGYVTAEAMAESMQRLQQKIKRPNLVKRLRAVEAEVLEVTGGV